MIPRTRRGMTISLEFLLGIIISLMLILGGCTIIAKLTRLTQDSADSFDELVNLIKEVNGQSSGSTGSMTLRMDKETFIVGFPNEDETNIVVTMGFTQGGYSYLESESIPIKKPLDKGCEKGKSCLCLCRERELDSGTLTCKDGKLICKNFDSTVSLFKPIVIVRSAQQKGDTYIKGSGDQLQPVYVEKYGSSIAVCKQIDDKSGFFCVNAEDLEQEKAIEGLKMLKTFIESCKSQTSDSTEPCVCGTFNFNSYFYGKYDLRFSYDKTFDSPELKPELKLSLTIEGKISSEVSESVDIPLCVVGLKAGESDTLDPPFFVPPLIQRDPPSQNYFLYFMADPSDEVDLTKNNINFLHSSGYHFYYVTPSSDNSISEDEINDQDKTNPQIVFINLGSDTCILRWNAGLNGGIIRDQDTVILWNTLERKHQWKVNACNANP